MGNFDFYWHNRTKTWTVIAKNAVHPDDCYIVFDSGTGSVTGEVICMQLSASLNGCVDAAYEVKQ